MSLAENVQFGIFTPPHQVDYADLLRVWTEADEIPEIAHAWLFDHLIPIAGDVTGPVLEGGRYCRRSRRRRSVCVSV